VFFTELIIVSLSSGTSVLGSMTSTLTPVLAKSSETRSALWTIIIVAISVMSSPDLLCPLFRMEFRTVLLERSQSNPDMVLVILAFSWRSTGAYARRRVQDPDLGLR